MYFSILDVLTVCGAQMPYSSELTKIRHLRQTVVSHNVLTFKYPQCPCRLSVIQVMVNLKGLNHHSCTT